VTKVASYRDFFGEDYHQDYLTHTRPTYMAYKDLPKVENLKKIFAERTIWRSDAVGAFPTDVAFV